MALIRDDLFTTESPMRIPVVCTVFAFGLMACHRSTAYLSFDDISRTSSRAPDSTPCNDVEQQGEEVDLAGSREVTPKPRGGTIEDGTYVLTSSTLYTNDRPHGAKLVKLGKITLHVKGATSQMVRTTADGQERRTTVHRESSGTVTTLRTICAFPRSNESETTSTTKYTATSTSFQFITPGPAGTVVATYTKL